MDPERVRAYLQAACAGLGFDIGEVWWTSNENGSSTVAAIEDRAANGALIRANNGGGRRLRFVQLYLSKTFENRRDDLVNPEEGTTDSDVTLPRGLHRSSSSENLQKHVLSPRLVDAIAKSTQVVWANSRKQEGLLGRSDIRLQTAVGMPVAVDGNGNMCVVVMFSSNNMTSTDDAMEFLQSISHSATASSIPCLLPVLDPKTTGMRRLTHPDFQNHTETYNDANVFGDGVIARFVSLDHDEEAEPEIHNIHDLSSAPKDTFGIPMLPSFAEIGNVSPDDNVEVFDEASYGIWSTIMENNNQNDIISKTNQNGSYGGVYDTQHPGQDPVLDNDNVESDPALQVTLPNKPLMPECRMTRLEEFCHAFLDMSVFDLADVWIPAGTEYPDCLRHVISVASSSRNQILQTFSDESAHALVNCWNGAVGRAYSSGNPVWSANASVFVDTGRAASFHKAKIMTVLAVPVFSGKEILPACVVSCYSLVRSNSVPFVLRFVQQALRLLWDGLDKVKPHESVCKTMWKDVAPADLGEMAADVEMQQHFIQKKRPRTLMSQSEPQDPDTDNLASHLQNVTLPNGDTVTVPLDLTGAAAMAPSESVPELDAEDIQSSLYEAIRSIVEAVPFDDVQRSRKNSCVATNAERTKRAHIMGPLPAGGHNPLPMPHMLPTKVVGIAGAPPKPLQVHRITPPTASHKISPISSNPGLFAVQQNPIFNATSNQIAPIKVSYSAPAPQNPITVPQTDGDEQFCLPTNSDSDPDSMPSGKVCRIQGCDEPAAARRPYCIKHSGNRLCEHAGCSKCAQGSTRFCIAHGGGRRCTHPGCDKGARDKFFCAAHGGGKRCRFDGCNKSAVGGSSLCTAHGGGRRCSVDGCDKSAQSSTKFCVKHGGGKKCAHEGCSKVARGRTSYCAAHGGGVRCKLEGCNRVAIGKMQLCRAHGGCSSRPKKKPLPPLPQENTMFTASITSS